MSPRNETAIGVYRTLQGAGLRSAPEYRPEPATHENGEECQRTFVIGQWDDFERRPDGWAAYDKTGLTWRISEAEAAEIGEGLS